jgi:hypothetical protein
MGDVILRLHENSSPQKAIETIPCYVHNNTVITTLGYKRKSREVVVEFTDGTFIEVLHIGIFGYINGAGEHVNARTEGLKINQALDQCKYTINDPDKIILYKDVEIANRGLMEETGLSLIEDANAKFYIFGLNASPGRDSRYGDDLYTNADGIWKFGYKRMSESILIASIVKALPPDNLPTPSDLEEIDSGKAKLIEINALQKEFHPTGKYYTAFPIHVEHLSMLISKLPLLINA